MLGLDNAKKLRHRLGDIAAAENVTDLVAGNPHPLRGNRDGQLSISLAGGTRLVIKPSCSAIPQKSDGGIDWAAVKAVTVYFIGDYHD